MRLTTLTIAVALTSMAPLANANGDDDLMIAAACYPGADDGAEQAGKFYYKAYGRTTRYVEVWEESNGIPGLQLDNGMACGRGADTPRADMCAGANGCFA